MKSMSKELQSMVTGFVVSEISSRALDGITYAIKDYNNSDCEDYIKIREEADKCGYDSDELFQVIEVSNGYIFDLDLGVTKKVSMDLVKASCNITGKHKDLVGILDVKVEQRRKRDTERLAKEILRTAKEGKSEVKVALYSNHNSDYIRILAKKENGEREYVNFKAYALRFSDIRSLNEEILSKSGYRISSVQSEYIIPRNKALLTTLEIQKLN